SFTRAQLLTETSQLLASAHVVVVYRAQEVWQRILECLGYEVVRRSMEQLLSSDDLVLRLEAQGECMSYCRRQRRTRLARRWLMEMIVNPCPAGKEGAEALRVGRLPKFPSIGNCNFVTHFNEALLARSRTRTRT